MPEENTSLLEAVKSLNTSLTTQNENLSKLFNPDSQGRRTGPFIRTGEDIMSSRGFMLSRVIADKARLASGDECKIERMTHERMTKELVARGVYHKSDNGSILVPLGSSLLLAIDEQMGSFVSELKEIMNAGVSGWNPEDVQNITNKIGYTKALSWNEVLNGGALVGPPQFGELIDLLRNNEVFMRAGARVYPMPANGRVEFPRQTNAATAAWSGEATSIDLSYPATGNLILTAKKLAIRTRIPNELLRFASVNVEQFVREDMMKVAALKLDRSLLDAVGSATEPKGLFNYSGISSYTASTTGADGDTFEPEDVLRFMGTIEEQNAMFTGWIMRPLMYAALANRRADATAPGDRRGPFMFNMMRDMMGSNYDVTREGLGSLEGKPVFKSTQVSASRAKGSATNLTYMLGGNFQDFYVMLSGVLELLVNPYGDTSYSTDQTEVRGIMFADGGPRHEASFGKVDTLIMA